MISPLAYVDPGAKLGNNVTVMPFAFIDKNVEIGDDCVIMSYASVLGGTRMGKKNVVHQHAVVGADPQDFFYTGEESELIIGDENKIRENVVISRATHCGNATRIGNKNFFMDKVHICHDVTIHDESVLGIGVSVAGECEIDSNVIVSSHVVLHQYVHVGRFTLIQSGCRLQKDVPPYCIMSGNPSAYHGVNSLILSHFKVSERILRHIANAYHLVFQGKFSLEDAMQKIQDQVPMSDEIQNIIDFIKNSKNGIAR